MMADQQVITQPFTLPVRAHAKQHELLMREVQRPAGLRYFIE